MDKHEQISTQTNGIYSALCKAQAMLNPADKDSVAGAGSYKYKYANLAAVMGAAQEALAVNNLAFTTRLETEEGKTVFYAQLVHMSGEFLQSRIELGINLHDIKMIQELGKAITYLRRYTFSMMIGVVTEEDDDAQSLVNKTQIKSPEHISLNQAALLQEQLKLHPDVAKRILDKYGSYGKFPANQLGDLQEYIKGLKSSDTPK